MTGCPSKAILSAYEQGELTDTSVLAIEHHVTQCAECQAAVDERRKLDAQARQIRTVFREIAVLEPTPLVEEVVATEPDSVKSKPVAPDAQAAEPHTISPASRNGRDDWPIPDYERVVLCGEGSYGSVWAVRDRVGVFRALKIIDLDRLKRAKAKCYEMSALESYCRNVTRHPYLVTVFHVGLADRFLYYTMELADDRSGARPNFENPSAYHPLTLDAVIRARRLHPDTAVELVRRLLHGLVTLHELNLIHHDIKPTNVIFVNRNPKLADIGVLTESDAVRKPIGTPRYMPPDRSSDRSADTYAMGRMLHEMLATRHATSFPRLPDECIASSAKWNMRRVEEVIVRACADEAKNRYASAGSMLEELEAAAEPVFSSLFDELVNVSSAAPPRTSPHPALQVLLALIHKIPWIAGLIALLYAIGRFTR